MQTLFPNVANVKIDLNDQTNTYVGVVETQVLCSLGNGVGLAIVEKINTDGAGQINRLN